MNLTINWNNYNGALEDGVNVYRDTNPIPDTPLPAPLASLAAGSNTYVDTTAVRGTKYYYRMGSVKGSDVLLTKNIVVKAVAPADTGPGPQVLQAGDWDLGYFGIAKSSDLITYASLTAAVGVTTGTVGPADKDWVKMAYKGKVLFIARGILRYGIPYNTLYQLGLIYGTNDNGLVTPSGITATNQYKPLVIGGFTVLPRILQGMPASQSGIPATSNNNSLLTAALASNEWDDIMGAIVSTTGAYSPRFVGDKLYGSLTNLRDEFGAYVSNVAISDLCQQWAGLANTSAPWRGGRVNSAGAGWNPGCAGSIVTNSTTLTGTMNAAAGLTIYPAWRPVLELVL
jgi:hypothetical protein